MLNMKKIRPQPKKKGDGWTLKGVLYPSGYDMEQHLHDNVYLMELPNSKCFENADIVLRDGVWYWRNIKRSNRLYVVG